MPKVTFILGGAASGKSAFAETLIAQSGKARRYVATAQAFDDEMRVKIDRHRAARGSGWRLVETPLDLAGALAAASPHEAVLVDCATMWLCNHLLAESNLATQQGRLLDAVAACPADLVIVANEVGQGIVPDNAVSRSFREAQGRLNIALAGQADLVVQVTAGLPLALKGRLP